MHRLPLLSSALCAFVAACADDAATKDGHEDAHADVTEACPGLDLPEAEPLTDPLHCSALEVETWELGTEQQVAFEMAGPAFSAPVVAPATDGALPSILLMDNRAQELIAVDGGTGTVQVLEPKENDGDSFAWGYSSDGSVRVAALWDTVDRGVDIWTSTGTATHVALEDGDSPSLADLDQDGTPEVLAGGRALTVLGETVGHWSIRDRTYWDLAVVTDAEAPPTVVTANGHVGPDGTVLTAWSEDLRVSYMGYLQAYPVFGPEVAYLLLDGYGPKALDGSGAEVWAGLGGSGRLPPEESGYTSAFGDTDGDGEPDLCALVGDRVVVVATDGCVLLDDPTGEAYAWTTGGCALADLDADGNHEVIAFGMFGLRVYDVETARLLSSREDICTRSWESPPVVADVDGDDSAEIVVAGSPGGCPDHAETGGHVFVVGPTEGRWARTRPVWNQVAYDPTAVTDDARIRKFPRPNPTTVRAYRAQPAQDGDRPDLVPEAVDACAESCADGTIQLAARVLNRGSVDAAAGAELVLYTYAEGGHLTEVASAVLSDGIPSGWASAAVILEVPVAAWGEARVLEVRGDPIAECDLLDDRIEEGIPDPCLPDP